MQLALDFEAGLTARFRSLKQACAHAVYAARGGLSGVASSLDMSPSELTKRLAEDKDNPDNRPLRAEDIEGIVASTGDRTPIYYLIEKYLQDPKAKRDQALATMAEMAPVFVRLAEEAGIALKRK